MLKRSIHSVVLLALAIAARAEGSVSNGDFETGTLASWATIGASHADAGSTGALPYAGTYQAYIDNTGNFASPISPLVTFLGVPGTSLLALGEGSPTTGSAIKQSVTANAGDVLSFQWNFMTDEHNEGLAFNDFCIYSVDGVPFLLASRNSTFSTLDLASPPTGFDGQTHYAGESYTFTTSGSHLLTYAVFNVGDAGHNSVLLVDGVTISVPEPTALSTLGLGALLLLRRRRAQGNTTPASYNRRYCHS